MKKRGSLIKLFTIVFLLGSIFLFSDVTFADEVDLLDESNKGKIIELHKKMDSVAHVDNGWMYQDVIRTFGWGVIILQAWLVDLVENGVRGILQFNNFYDSFGINELIEKLTPYVLGLFLLSFIYLGYLFMTNKIDKRNEVIGNVLIAFSLIFAIPVMMPYLDKVMQVGVDQLDGSNQEEIMLSRSILKQNVADVKYYVDTEFNFNQLGTPLDKKAAKGQNSGSADYSKANRLKQMYIDPTEKLDLQSEEGWFGWWSTGYKEELEKNNKLGHDFLISRLVYDGDGETPRLLGLSKGKFGSDLGQQSYYRYHINWWTVIFTFGIVAFALGITVIKMARVMFDLAFHAVFSPFVAATDLTGGQRTKKMVTEIVSSFAVLFVMVLILRIFTMYTNYVLSLSATVGNLVAILMLLAGAWALIDAPDIVQRLLGIDAGLRSGYQALVGTLAAGKMAMGAGKAAGKVASGIGAGAAAGTAFGRGVFGRPPNKNTNTTPTSGGFSPRGGGGGSSSGTRGSSTSAFGQSGETYSTGSVDHNSQFSSSGGSQTNATSGSPAMTNSSPSSGGMNPTSPSLSGQSSQVGGSGFVSTGGSNPYQKGNGIRSGSVRGQRVANLQARSHNSGVAFRQSLTSGGRALGRAAMGGARVARNPIRSVQNANLAVGVKTNQKIASANQQIESFGRGTKTLASKAIHETSKPLFDNQKDE